MVLEGLDEWVAEAQPGENRKAAAARIVACVASGAAELEVFRLGLTTLPDAIGALAHLQRLDCDNNQLTALPDSIGRLANLQRLWCYNNRLTALPDSIWQLTALQALYCAHNQLTALPETIGQLAQLQALYCHNNHLAVAPDWLLHRPVPEGTYEKEVGRALARLGEV